jgi:hypothetical protein
MIAFKAYAQAILKDLDLNRVGALTLSLDLFTDLFDVIAELPSIFHVWE